MTRGGTWGRRSAFSSNRCVGTAAAQHKHQRAESERVPGVREDAREREQILKLLTPEQSFAGLRRDRQALGLECAFVAPKLPACRRQQCNAAGREWDGRRTISCEPEPTPLRAQRGL